MAKDPTSIRRKLISLTTESKKTADRISPPAKAHVQRVTAQLDDQELKELKRLLGLITTFAKALHDDKATYLTSQDTKEVTRIPV